MDAAKHLLGERMKIVTLVKLASKCPVAKEFSTVRHQAYEKARCYPTLADAYGQVGLEMLRALRRHACRCEVCLSEAREDA